jgi:hypothetical protein
VRISPLFKGSPRAVPDSGDRRVGRAGLIRRSLEEEEARLLLFEVRGLPFCWVWFFGDQAF